MSRPLALLSAGLAIAAALPAAPIRGFNDRLAPSSAGPNLGLRGGGGPLSLEQAQMVTTGVLGLQGVGMIAATDKVADGYGVGTVSDFAKSLMQNMGFIQAGFALFWHLARTGSMSIDKALGVSIGFAGLDKIWWCINWAGPLKQGITGALVQIAIQMAVSYCLYNDINAQDVAKYYGMYGIVLGAIGYAFPKALIEAHGIKMADDPMSKEMMKTIMMNTLMVGLLCINVHTAGGPTNAFGAFWFANMINCYMFIANEDWKKIGMASATPMAVWLALSLVMVLSAGGASF